MATVVLVVDMVRGFADEVIPKEVKGQPVAKRGRIPGVIANPASSGRSRKTSTVTDSPVDVVAKVRFFALLRMTLGYCVTLSAAKGLTVYFMKRGGFPFLYASPIDTPQATPRIGLTCLRRAGSWKAWLWRERKPGRLPGFWQRPCRRC